MHFPAKAQRSKAAKNIEEDIIYVVYSKCIFVQNVKIIRFNILCCFAPLRLCVKKYTFILSS